MRTRYVSIRGIVDALVQGARMSRRKVSLALGKDSHFLSVHVRRVSNPSTKLVRDVADACGYEMLFRGHDEEILVVPPITDDDVLIGDDKKEDEND